MNSGSEVTALKSKDFVRVEYAAKLLPSSEQRELIEVLVNALFEQGDPEYEGGRLLLLLGKNLQKIASNKPRQLQRTV